MAGSAPRNAAPLSQRVTAMVQTAEFAWWLGHVVALTLGSLYLFRLVVTFTSVPQLYYRAYLGALASYLVVIYRSHGKPRFNTEFLQRIGSDENVQYFFLTVTWYLMAPLFVTIVPFVVFSALHVTSYLTNTVLPTIFPQIPSEVAAATARRPAGAPSTVHISPPARASMTLQRAYRQFNSAALNFASLWEVSVIMPALVLAAITFQGSFIAPFFYAHFLRMRYVFSSKTQQAFAFVRTKLDRFFVAPTAHPSIPPVVGQAYVKARDWIIVFGNKATQAPAATPNATGATSHTR